MPEDFDRVCWVSVIEELMVITFPEVPVQEKVPVKAVVAEAGNVTVLGGLIVKSLKVFAPLNITAPVPDAVIVK